MQDKISNVMKSNLLTMTITREKDDRQGIPEAYTIPLREVRLLRAKLILEEALETCEALGFLPGVEPIDVWKECKPNLEEVIDGCCDVIYVATGTLASCGVPDLPHLDEVCKCNNAKFPGGIATVNEFGKYMKPEGWVGPDHKKVATIVDEDHLEDLMGIGLDLLNSTISDNDNTER